MILRDYQTDLINRTREAFISGADAVCVQLPTGGGKTPIQVSIINSIFGNKKRAWHISPRHEIQFQVAEHFKKWGITHGYIDANHKESKAYNINIISKDTLTRRWDKIKQAPDYAIIDECHLNYNFQIEFRKRFPDCRIIGMSATPERLSGEGLSKKNGGIYDVLIEGASIPDLTARNFLSKLRYFAPPIQGLDNLHRKGSEYDSDEVEQLLQKRRIYGEAIEHYRNYADGKPCLIFCRSIKAAEETAHRFSAAGYKFENIDGKFTRGARKNILDALRTGKINGVCSVDLFLYGLDIPRIEVGIMLRPTLSRALYMQMIGRILRPFEGKDSAVIFDHVGNLIEHQEPDFQGIPLHYLDKIHWNFDGTEKRKRNKNDERLTTLKLCSKCYLYFEGNICPNCGTACGIKQREELKKVEAELIEIIPVPLADRSPEEKKEYQDRINSCVERTGIQIDSGAVGEMKQIADELGYNALWVYHKLNQPNRLSVNQSLLAEIARVYNYKPQWAWVQSQKMKGKF